jgi:chromosome segregation ATPase
MSNEIREADREIGAGATSRVTNDGEAIGEMSTGQTATAQTAGGGSDEQARFDERLRAVERAVTGTDATVADIADGAAATEERATLEARLTDLEARIEELEAATQALRGYAGSVRAVNREVERRADLALARASGEGNDCDGSEVSDGDHREEITAHRLGDVASGAVPSESALDAAVPSDPENSRGVEQSLGGDATVGDETGVSETEDGSWRAGALDRLRESL